MSFKNLNLSPEILKAIAECGYENPTPIQEQAIPVIASGKDLRASAQTGTGKTAAFILPALQKLIEPSAFQGKGPRILILVPTRELACQVAEEAVRFSRFMKRTTTVCIYGGAPYPTQRKQLSRPYEILVATPGRLMDHMESGRIDLSRIETFILDEADRMLDMGFIQAVEQIAEDLPKERQTLMFSATFEGKVLSLSKRLMKDPAEINLAPKETRHENIEQYLHYVDNVGHKIRLLDHLLNDSSLQQAIVFTSTKSYADELCDELNEMGHDAAPLHGDLNQRKRTQTLTRLRDGKIKILVATDVAARGIDVQTISHVINFDLPRCAEDYVHRIGRTGRAQAKGTAFSFAANKDRQLVKNIEKFTGYKIATKVVAGFESSVSTHEPRGGDGQQRRRGNRPPFFKKKRY